MGTLRPEPRSDDPRAPPSYTSFVGGTAPEPTSWALAACAADPAMRRAFVDAGAKRGYAGGPELRGYCEREGLMRSERSSSGVEKRVLAAAWELADCERDVRGLSFDAFCVFMHLLCIATAGGELPPTLPEELVPPSFVRKRTPPPIKQQQVAEGKTAPPQPPDEDELLARALQEQFDAETLPRDDGLVSASSEVPPPAVASPLGTFALDDGSEMDRANLLRLLVSQGGVVELGQTLYASDDAFENETWGQGGFSRPLTAWTSEDGTVSAAERCQVAPPREKESWTEVQPWTIFIALNETDRNGWLYSRGASTTHADEESAMPFPGAKVRRRRWMRVHSRELSKSGFSGLIRDDTTTVRKAPALLARLQDSWRVGFTELGRRLSTTQPVLAKPAADNMECFAERWQSASANKCSWGLATFVKNFGKHETPNGSDEARALRVRRYMAHAAVLLRSERAWSELDDDPFLADMDEVEALLYASLMASKFQLVLEFTQSDVDLADRLQKLQFLTPRMLDAAEVEHLAPWPRAVAELAAISEVLTPRRKIAKIKLAIGCIFECLSELQKEKHDRSEVLPGADDLLPLVILATLRAAPPKLQSEVRFMELYSTQDRLVGEDGFLLTQVAAAASFLENLESDQLKDIDADTAAKIAALGSSASSGLVEEEEEKKDVEAASVDDDDEQDAVQSSAPVDAASSDEYDALSASSSSGLLEETKDVAQSSASPVAAASSSSSGLLEEETKDVPIGSPDDDDDERREEEEEEEKDVEAPPVDAASLLSSPATLPQK